MIAYFFIDRPIFATVLSVLIVLTGILAFTWLPVAQYPQITPPSVMVTISYPGANAQVVADTVAAPIEQQVNGIEGMMYMSSTSANDGSYTLTVTFKLGTNLNTALVMLQNRVALAMPQLPPDVQRQGILIKKRTPDILLVVNLVSPDNRYDDIYLSNFATLNLRDELLRVDGVSDVTYLGQRDYSIRVWLDPQKLAAMDLTASDVASAIRSQSTEAPAGSVGKPPAGPAQPFQLPIDTLGRLSEPEQFGQVIVKTVAGPDDSAADSSSVVRLRDVGRVEMAAQNYNQSATFDGKPSIVLAVRQLPGTNAINVARDVRDKLKELKKSFPEGVDYEIGYDTTPTIEESITDVKRTLIIAVVLVAVVVLVFLQNWRSALIPLLAVPVAVLGTFAVMWLLGFSLNNLTLFGLVLAIGIVVDDAIVVVENVERWVEHGLSPRDATRKAMQEVTGPIVAVALVLCAVFVPCAFLEGITGLFFKQFAVTIAVSTVISAFNSLTLSPALAVILLKPRGASRDFATRLLDFCMGWFFRLFNRGFAAGTSAYAWLTGRLLRLSVLVLVVYAALLVVTWGAFSTAPQGFVPDQDLGRIYVNVQLPDSASLQRTQEVMAQVEAIARKTPGVEHTTTISGLSPVLWSSSSNFGVMFVSLDPFAKRTEPHLGVNAVIARLRREYARQIKGAKIDVYGAPPIPGLSLTGGFKFMVEDRGGGDLKALEQNSNRLIEKMSRDHRLIYPSTQFSAGTPQLFMDINRTKAKSLGVSIHEIDQALQMYLGSLYANSFNAFGREWQVTLQAEGKYRSRVSDLDLIQVRNDQGQMVPLGTLVDVRDDTGPVAVIRYNLYPAVPIMGGPRPGVSSEEVTQTIEQLSEQTMPRSTKTEWTELYLIQNEAKGTGIYVFALAVVFVFLALAALYESWALPLAVILVVPLCLLCAVGGVLLNNVLPTSKMSIDVFVEVGLVVLMGLACKNAILIVEFAQQLRQEGRSSREATIEACRLRLRPILMTSFAFILGTVPLVIASGAGAEMRRSLGTAVFAGMLGVTLFGIFLTPVFFHVIAWLGETRLLRSALSRWIGSPLMGGLVGLMLGYLLAQLRTGDQTWGPVIGAAGGAVAGFVIPTLVRAVRLKVAA
jgi:multidrug efflux pump